MNCYTFKDRVSDYLEKKLSIYDKKSFEKQLKTCLCCSEIYYGVKSLIFSSKKLNKVSVSSDFNKNLFVKIKKTKNPNQVKFYNKNFFGYKSKYIFGSFVSSLMILFIILNLFDNKNSEVINIQPKNENNILKNNQPLPIFSNQSVIDSIVDSTQKNNIKNNFLNSKGQTVDYTP